MTVGKRIQRLRKEIPLSQKELAERLQIGHSTLACYETDKRQVPHEVLIALARLFGVSTDYLLGLEN